MQLESSDTFSKFFIVSNHKRTIFQLRNHFFADQQSFYFSLAYFEHFSDRSTVMKIQA